MPGIDEQSFMDFYSGTPCKACEGDGCEGCDWQGLLWPEPPPYTDADRAYDRQAFAADYGLQP